MGPIIFIIVLLILANTGVLGSRVTLAGFSNFNPGKARVQADFRKLQRALRQKRDQLVPWSDEERSLLSLRFRDYKEYKGSVKRAGGTIESIYHEPLVHFAYKRYISKRENAIMVVLTSHYEYLYRIKNGRVEVACNGTYLAGITNNKLIGEGDRVLAYIEPISRADYAPIYVRGREVGTIGNRHYVRKVNPRAFELLSEMSPEDEKYLLALAFYYIIRNQFQKI